MFSSTHPCLGLVWWRREDTVGTPWGEVEHKLRPNDPWTDSCQDRETFPGGVGEAEQKPPPEGLNPWGLVVDSPPEGEGENHVEQNPVRHMVDMPQTKDPDPWGVVVDSPAEGEGGTDIGQIPIGPVWDILVGPELQYGYVWGHCSPLGHNNPVGRAETEAQIVRAFWGRLGREGCYNLTDKNPVGPVESFDGKRFRRVGSLNE